MASLIRQASPYEEHRDYVLAVLAHRCGWLDATDRESLLHDAYAVFLEKHRDGKLDVDAMRPAQIRAYLTQTAVNKAMDEGKRAWRRSLSLDDENLGLDPADCEPDLDDRLASRFDDARVREIVAELPERQQVVIQLRYFFNHTPQEIQRYLGVTERVYRRELERATRHISERFELVRGGSFCQSRVSLIRAYVAGVAGPRRTSEARRHIETCPACAHLVAELRAAARRAAGLVPPPLAGLPAAHGLLARWLDAAQHLRHRVAWQASSARDHFARAASAADPSKLTTVTAARPGAVALLVTGCLAGGTTTTYCIVHGVPDPLRALGVLSSHPPHRPRRARPTTSPQRAERAAARLTPVPPVGLPSRQVIPATAKVPAPVRRTATNTRAARGRRRSQASAATTARTRPSRVQAATAPEFGVGGGSPVSTASASSTRGSSSSGSSGASAGSGPVTPSSAAAPPTPTTHLPEFDP